MEAETRTVVKGGRWSRLEAKLGDLTPRQRLLTLLLISVLVYGGLILMDGLLLRSFIDQNFANSSDLSIFQERARLILNGGMIYRDVPYGSFPVESPPLINYLFLPPQLAGGEWWAYEIWFSLFAPPSHCPRTSRRRLMTGRSNCSRTGCGMLLARRPRRHGSRPRLQWCAAHVDPSW